MDPTARSDRCEVDYMQNENSPAKFSIAFFLRVSEKL
jgi:hypothetical protein